MGGSGGYFLEEERNFQNLRGDFWEIFLKTLVNYRIFVKFCPPVHPLSMHLEATSIDSG